MDPLSQASRLVDGANVRKPVTLAKVARAEHRDIESMLHLAFKAIGLWSGCKNLAKPMGQADAAEGRRPGTIRL
jgi:hypothetical protein